MRCRVCGTEHNSKFCPECGAQQTLSEGAAQQNQIPVRQMGGMPVSPVPKENKKRTTIISIVCIVCAALLLVSLFLPYASMRRDLAKQTLAEPKVKLEKNITNHDLVRLSIFKFTKINQIVLGSKNDKTYIVLFSLLAVFSGLALLFSALKKPAGIIVFDVLFTIVALLYNWDFASRNMMSSGTYRWDVAHVFVYLFAALLFVGAIVMIVFKTVEKKERKKN